MNVFSVGDGKEYELTRENFIEFTHKKFPFYQDPKKSVFCNMPRL